MTIMDTLPPELWISLALESVLLMYPIFFVCLGHPPSDDCGCVVLAYCLRANPWAPADTRGWVPVAVAGGQPREPGTGGAHGLHTQLPRACNS